MLRRLAVPALLVALLVPGAGAAAAATPAPETAPVDVTAVLESPDGRLTFVTERAGSRTRGQALARRWRGAPRVVAAAVATPVRALDVDPLRGQQWGLTTLSAERVWAQGPASGQLVAVLDTGVDASHADLAPVVVPGLDLISGGDGRVDPHGHGTHVAGVVSAVAGNGTGGAGLAQGSRVLPIRVLDATGEGVDADVARGLVWAVDAGAAVANLSLGGDALSPVLGAAVDYALRKGVAVVAASGNEGDHGDPVLYPAATPGVIAVAAVDGTDARPTWSSSGSHVAVSAPGVGILSTVPGNGHQAWSGTSMAAPFVAAAAALLVSAEPSLTPAQVRARLMSTARDVGAAGFDRHTGAGVIDVVAARAVGLPTAPVAAAAPAASSPVVPAPVVVEPAPAPTVTAAPVPSALRGSRSAAVVTAGRPVVLAARAVSTVAVAGASVVLERRVGTGPWTAIRSGPTDAQGLVSWTLLPDRSGSHRFRSGSLLSPELPVDVRQAVTATARRSAGTAVVDVRVVPGGAARVVLQVLRSTGWTGIASATTTASGTARFVKAVPVGSRLRVVAAARPALLAGTSSVRVV